MLSALLTLALLVATSVTLKKLHDSLFKYKRLPYPPGPQPIPLLGNSLHMPKSYYWMAYAEWGRDYGDVVHAEAFGQHYVILNSLKAAEDLLVKKSAIYSDRPRAPMINELYVLYVHSFDVY